MSGVSIDPGTPCLVTGASSGIGLEVARELARHGARVALVARSPEPLAEAAVAIDELGGEGLALPADVTDEASMEEAVGRAVETFGGLKLVVANAGLGRYTLVEEMGTEAVETTMRINYEGLARTVRLALPHLLAATPSSVVGVSSAAGIIPHRLGAAYCASKAACNMFLDALRLEVHDRGVTVTKICPGFVETPFAEKSELDPKRDLPLLNRLLVRDLDAAEVAETVVAAVESGKSEVVTPPMMRFFAWTRRTTPRLADWVNRKTG